MNRPLPWKPIAIATTAMCIVLALLLLPACCCRGRAVPVAEPAKSVIPLIGTKDIPTPTEAEAKAPVEAEMHNVWFHIDQTATHVVFLFERVGVTDGGKVQGRFRSSGETPKILERLKISGIQIPLSIFDEVVDVNL